MKASLSLHFAIFILGILIFSCPVNPPIKPGNGSNPVNISPPSNVRASSEYRKITISWGSVENAKAYQVYKSVEGASFVPVQDGITDNTQLTYKEYTLEKNITYAVQSIQDGQYSNYSASSNLIKLRTIEAMTPPAPQVISFSEKEGIIIRWEADLSADSYVLYRKNSSGDFNFLEEIPKDQSLYPSFIDKDITLGEFYSYKLAYKWDGQIHELSNENQGAGFTGDKSKDNYEDNETMDKATILHPKSLNDCTIYYFTDNRNNIYLDNDWYKITVDPNSTISVKFSGFENIGSDELYFNCPGEDKEFLSQVNNEYTLKNDSPTTRDIFFQISVNQDRMEQQFRKYTIEVGE